MDIVLLKQMSRSARESFGNISCGNGVFCDGKTVYLFTTVSNRDKFHFGIETSTDGLNFQKLAEKGQLVGEDKKPIDLTKCGDFRISPSDNKYILNYRFKPKGQINLHDASSKDLTKWIEIARIASVKETGMIVPSCKYKSQYILYYGGKAIFIALSKNLKKWTLNLEPIFMPEQNKIINIGGIVPSLQGILVLYMETEEKNDSGNQSLQLAVFDKADPKKLIWRSKEPIWETPEGWQDQEVSFIGTAVLGDRLISYWNTKDGISMVGHASLSDLWKLTKVSAFTRLRLNKVRENPIIKPIFEHFWESRATFNPAALYADGKVHLVYRAIGDSDKSVLGYASSSDGVHINERRDEPIFTASDLGGVKAKRYLNYSPYQSGGGSYGGIEDPRLTKIDDKVYMTYVNYDGWSHPRVALTSIGYDDFKNHRFNWEEPVLISPPGVVDKNACILPEKINGKYVIFHRIFPNILIDFVDSLDFDGKTKWLAGEYAITPRKMHWDSRKVGVGPTPIKTDDGWLVIYHAVGEKDWTKYKMGAMLLSLSDPTKVIFRSDRPILEPDEIYENEGYKGGVAYPCGAVTMENKLIVYYGGADMVVCAAAAILPDFLNQLRYNGSSSLELVNRESPSN